jgi:hypothetical protein
MLPLSATTQITSIQSRNQLQRAFVDPGGHLTVTSEGSSLLSDQFDGTTIDTVYRWVSTLGGTGVATQGGGLLVLTVGTTASNAAALASIENFYSVGSSALNAATIVQFEAGNGVLLPLNVNAFFGQGTPNASFTASTPLANAIGFERAIDGTFSAVYYNTNVRTVIKDLTSYVIDGAPHLIYCRVRADVTYFFINDIEEPVASVQIVGPATINLPVRMHAINHTSPPLVAPTIRFFGATIIDSGSTYPMLYNGQVLLRQRQPGVFINLTAVSVAAEATIWTPASGRRFRLMGFVLTAGTVAGNITIKDNTAGTTILVIPFGTAAGTIISPPMGNGILSAAANNVLTATGTATQTLSGYVFGTEE